ncbi:hypothetical protein B0H13DRAFT_2453154 [Mycena leptocephala]|nr:hypothetical protein B0H13DRAFT_2453154 [Mycena leptocephala]
MKDVLGGNVTHTPVGTSGPAVPGGFPAHLEPDTPDYAPQDTLLATAQSYMPAWPPRRRTSRKQCCISPGIQHPYIRILRPPLPPSSPSLSSASRSRHPRRRPPQVVPHHVLCRDTFSTQHTPGTLLCDRAALALVLLPSPSAPRAPRASSPRTPTSRGLAFPTSSCRPLVPTRCRRRCGPEHPQLVNPPSRSPRESTTCARAESSSSAPSASTNTTQEHPRATSGLLPSHPGVADPGVNALERGGEVHPTPHGVPASMPSTPSLTGGESGYAASSETEGESVRTPGSEPAFTTPVPIPTPTPHGYGDGNGEAEGEGFAGVGAHGSAALNFSLKTTYPRDLDLPQSHDIPPATGDFTRLEERLRRAEFGEGDIAAPPSGLNAVYRARRRMMMPVCAGEEDVVDAGGETRERRRRSSRRGQGQMKSKKSKKPKLIQRSRRDAHRWGRGRVGVGVGVYE